MTDEELLDAWAGGDEGAGEELFRRSFALLYRFFRNKTPDHCEDLIQTTMLECIRSRDRFRSESSFRVFLLGIARNCLSHHFRGRRRDRLDLDWSTRSIADLDPRPSTIVARNAEHVQLLEAMRHIPVDLQVVLELHYWEELSTNELSEVLEIPQGTVKSRLRRARRALHEVLIRDVSPAEVDEERLGQELGRLREVVDDN